MDGEAPRIELQERKLDDCFIARWVQAINGIGTSVFVAALALTCLRVYTQETSCGRVVVSGSKVVEAEVCIVLFAAVEIVVRRRASRSHFVAKGVVLIAVSKTKHDHSVILGQSDLGRPPSLQPNPKRVLFSWTWS
jgi:hypothetical protein